ncbi:MAG: metal ABC transporter substrate-binding protein [Gammaproteobacteria bacterium]|nr:metal ABC transporter substrate-binding protein [Gammaproteobacteria bacterium]
MILNICKKIVLLMPVFIVCLSVVQAEQTDYLNFEQSLDESLTSSVITKPNIVVSIEPLYEIVSSLSHGVVKPEVIYLNFSEIKQPLTAWQQEKLQAADIIVRVGEGLEPELDHYLNQQGKQLRDKTLTLSNYIPLLEKAKLRAYNPDAIFTDRQASSDLRFWMDPRLVKMLTDFIAPKLVVMDPNHQEEYLENEIVLRAQLKKVEAKMQSLFKNLSLEQKFQVALFNPYLKNRYMSFAEISHMSNKNLLQPGVASCIQNKSFVSIPLNLNYTEKTLNSLLLMIEQCSKSNIVSS